MLPFAKARKVLETTFASVCDPDGDAGTAPDVETSFNPDDPEAPPLCPEGSTAEFDLHPKQVRPQGNAVFTGANDFENSGLRTGEMLQDSGVFFDESPWTVKFSESSPKQGWRFMCTIHGLASWVAGSSSISAIHALARVHAGRVGRHAHGCIDQTA